ncbi:MAG: TraR/DksA C4-type zinc finger protein [Polaromonas sp.]|nr:TraR/DksA C4-type zinc finger protein [Polaromonas sp.]
MDLEQFRRRITSDLAQIEEAIAQAQASAGTVTLDQSSVGRLSRMDAMQQQAMAQGMRERLLLQRRKLDGALARIDAATFGRCCECDAAIEPTRLEADPAVIFCFDCQAERDSGSAQR